MLPDLLGLLVAAVVLYVPFAVRRLRRVTPPAGEQARPQVQPRGGVTAPFGYDNGLITGGEQ